MKHCKKEVKNASVFKILTNKNKTCFSNCTRLLIYCRCSKLPPNNSSDTEGTDLLRSKSFEKTALLSSKFSSFRFDN